MNTVVGAVNVDPIRRRSKVSRFKFAVSTSSRRGCIAHVSGPLSLLNGACQEHANCTSSSYDSVQVALDRTILKGEELTLCYDEDEPLDVGSDKLILCGYKGCKTVIMQ